MSKTFKNQKLKDYDYNDYSYDNERELKKQSVLNRRNEKKLKRAIRIMCIDDLAELDE